jgi:hypothetical protein
MHDPPVTDIERARDRTAAAVLQAEIAIESMCHAMRELRDAISEAAAHTSRPEEVGKDPSSPP